MWDVGSIVDFKSEPINLKLCFLKFKAEKEKSRELKALST